MPSMPIGVDLAKSVFEVALSTVPVRVAERQRLSRAALGRFFAQRPPAEVLLEACGSAHHWGRALQRLGHQVALLHPGDVARYRDGHKTDRADATALLEAARNQALSRVPVKSVEQQAVGALHRLRQGYLQTRTARRTLESVIGYAQGLHCGAIPDPRTSQLPTNPILAAPVRRLADRRISAGFIVEAATGTPGHLVLTHIRAP